MTVDARSVDVQLFNRLFSQAPIGVVVIDESGKVLSLNKVAKEYFLELRVGRVLLQSKDWPSFRKLLQVKKPFYYLVDEQGFIFTPQPMDNEETLLWMIPSESMRKIA